MPVKKNKNFIFIKTDEIVQIQRMSKIKKESLGMIEKIIVDARGDP